MFESGINIKNELSASDLITTRLTELEALQRRTIQILMSTDDTFRSLMSRLDQVADIGKYAPVIGTEVKACLPVNCLSIDNYLGSNYPLYDKIGIYKYQRPNMRREKVASDYIIAWISSEFTNNIADNLLSDMIRHGKILYITSTLMPETSEHIIMGYSEQQWNWAKENEANMWNALIASKDLYSTSMLIKNQYIGDGPFTKPFTQESPGRAGTYIGWQIVEDYMKHNPEISIQQLLQQPDAQVILNNSNYRP